MDRTTPPPSGSMEATGGPQPPSLKAGAKTPGERNDLPLVSIITPTYNHAAYLEETIDSVLTQDYPRIEYIVLDDGSTDGTREILAKYTGRIRWESHQNMGETRTVNKGLAMATGEILGVVNSDDPLLPGAVLAAVTVLADHPDVLVAYPDLYHIDPSSNLIRGVRVPEFDYRRMVGRHECTVGPGAFFRRQAVALAGLRDPQFKYVADFDFWLRVGRCGPFMRIPQPLATFRCHPASASVGRRGADMASEHIEMIRKYYDQPEIPQEILKLKKRAYSAAHYCAGVACGPARGAALAHLMHAIALWPWGTLRYWRLMAVVILPVRWRTALRLARQRGWAAVNALRQRPTDRFVPIQHR